MGLEELKASMDPSKYIGRSKEQVEAFLKNVISPILEANKDLLGVKAEINVQTFSAEVICGNENYSEPHSSVIF